MAEPTVSPKVAAYIERVSGSLERMKKAAVEQKGTIIIAGSAAAASFAGAYINARYPDRKIAGADPDAVLAVACGVGAMMTSGTTQQVLEGAAIGAACSVTARLGAQKGAAALAAKPN